MKKDKRFPYEITLNQAKQIISSACTDWKEKLSAEWGKVYFLRGYIRVEESLYVEMREACKNYQHEVLDSIFGKDEPKIKYPPIGSICEVWDDSRDDSRKYLKYYVGSGKFTFCKDHDVSKDNDGRFEWDNFRVLEEAKE